MAISYLTGRKSLFVNVFNQSNSFENPICIETRLKNMLEVTLFYFKNVNAMGTSTSKFAIKSTWFLWIHFFEEKKLRLQESLSLIFDTPP